MNKVIIYKEKIPKKDMFVEGGNKKGTRALTFSFNTNNFVIFTYVIWKCIY